MGTKVQFDNYWAGYYSMRDLSHDSNGGSWPTYYGDHGFPNPQFCYGFSPGGISDSYLGYNRDIVKQTMLKHEAIFKNQVCELHRLYGVQRDLMDEFRRKEHFEQRIPYETSSSSSPLPSQIPSEDAIKWNSSSFPLVNSVSGRPPVSNSDIIQSSPNTVKGKSTQASPIPFQNCSSPKGSEASEFRPTKFRRKMLDLQLPAIEYIDMEEVEQCGGATVSDISNCPDGNHNFGPQSGVELFLSHCGKIECHGDASRSDSGLKKSHTLADLNEPLQVEEVAAFPSADFLGHTIPLDGSQDQDFSSKFPGLPKDISQNSRHFSLNGNSNGGQFQNKGNGQGWFSCMFEAEQSKDKLRSLHRGTHQPEKVPPSSQPLRFLLEQTCRPSGFLLSDHTKQDSWGVKTGSIFRTSAGNRFHSSYNESLLATHSPTPSSFAHSSDLANSWDHLAWAKPNNRLSQKSMSVQTNPYMTSGTLSKGSQSAAQSNEFLENKWHPNSNPVVNPGFGNELPLRNGFCQGFLSVSRELSTDFPPPGFDHANFSNDDKRALGSSYLFKGSSHMDMNSAKDLNLNMLLSNGLSRDLNSQRVVKIIDIEQKQEDSHPVLPWLRAKGGSTDEAVSSGKGPSSLESSLFQCPTGLFNNNDVRKSMDCHYSVASTSGNGDVKALMHGNNECPTSNKILGVPIFRNSLVVKNDVSSVLGPSYGHRPSGDEEVASSPRKGGIDINMPCDSIDLELGETAAAEVTVLEKRTESKGASLRDHIDLNTSISEDDVPLANSSTCMKRDTGIDLEAPVVLEPDEASLSGEESIKKQHESPLLLPQHRADDLEIEFARMAAEALVGISACVHQDLVEDVSVHQNHIQNIAAQPVEVSSEDPLRLFADVVCSFSDDHKSRPGADSKNKDVVREHCSSSELDYFESMTLKLTGCSAEEYFPKPQLPEFLNLEATGTNLANRTRKGQARRGRQRRDFQRDILPGLASLSRHEVTEDLQTFGGLMRASGHSWQSGTRRNATRNGFARGRRRSAAAAPPPPSAVDTVCALLKQHLNSNEVGLEDRSLTGWGKTTRRPRRQRCPAGNLAPVALT
ncbi:hypothetical protein Ancab_020797 [Ancistrocladus abbreviatus]